MVFLPAVCIFAGSGFFMQIYMKGGLNMTKEAQEARREYLREWRRTHKDNIRKHNQTYWEKKAREAAAAAQNPEELTDDQLRELVNQSGQA